MPLSKALLREMIEIPHKLNLTYRPYGVSLGQDGLDRGMVVLCHLVARVGP